MTVSVESVVAQWSGARGPRFDPHSARKISESEHAFSSVICRDDTR